MSKAFHDDLRPDAGGVTHCDSEGRQEGVVHEISLWDLENGGNLLRDGFSKFALSFRSQMDSVDSFGPDDSPRIKERKVGRSRRFSDRRTQFQAFFVTACPVFRVMEVRSQWWRSEQEDFRCPINCCHTSLALFDQPGQSDGR